jgi:hypothetical protein
MATEGQLEQERRRPDVQLDPAVHRRILAFLNDAVQERDLVYERLAAPTPEMDPHDGHQPAERIAQRRKVLDQDTAREIIEFRDREFPLGFRNVNELLRLDAFTVRHLDILQSLFSTSLYGSWSVFPQQIPRRGPGGYDGVVHAAMLHTGKVLFITADETTLLWDPEDATPDPGRRVGLLRAVRRAFVPLGWATTGRRRGWVWAPLEGQVGLQVRPGQQELVKDQQQHDAPPLVPNGPDVGRSPHR